jgi:hypothetical protein
MKFSIKSWKISDLLELYEKKKLNLNPPYQRNDIWTLPAKKRLIDSIKLGYPMPTFFIYKSSDDEFEMVDGQQRTRAIYGYIKGFFPDMKRKKFDRKTDEYLLNEYDLPIILIEQLSSEDSLEDFYYRVNKFGSKLNRPEIIKAQYYDSPFQRLVEKVAYSESFLKLSLFSDSSLSRMQDLDFSAELLTLVKVGNYEKKKAVDDLYEAELTDNELNKMETKFFRVLTKIERLNQIFPLKESRYRQRNDFYTVFGFINKNYKLDDDVLIYFYKVLILIGDDISPTNEDCWSFQEYATNCVSQSNSKRARSEREEFMTNLLLNTDPKPFDNKDPDKKNYVLIDVLKYYKIKQENLKKINGYYTLPVDELNEIKQLNFSNDIQGK